MIISIITEINLEYQEVGLGNLFSTLLQAIVILLQLEKLDKDLVDNLHKGFCENVGKVFC